MAHSAGGVVVTTSERTKDNLRRFTDRYAIWVTNILLGLLVWLGSLVWNKVDGLEKQMVGFNIWMTRVESSGLVPQYFVDRVERLEATVDRMEEMLKGLTLR